MIVRDWYPLSLSYLPPKLVHREREVEKILSFIRRPEPGIRPETLILDGPTGTGKTALVRWVLLRHGFDFAYVNAQMKNVYQILLELAHQVTGRQVKMGYSSSQIVRMIGEREGHKIMVLDEVDRCQERDPKKIDGLLASLMRMEGSSLILITNKMDWADTFISSDLEPYVGSRIRLTHYKAPELYDILKQRAELALEPGSWDDEALHHIAAASAQTSGSAKEAIELLAKACKVARERLTLDVVKEVMRDAEIRGMREVISSYPLHHKLILAELVEAGRKLKSTELYRRYVARARRMGTKPLTKPSFMRILSDLSVDDIISLRKTGGRGSPYMVSLSIPRGWLEGLL